MPPEEPGTAVAARAGIGRWLTPSVVIAVAVVAGQLLRFGTLSQTAPQLMPGTSFFVENIGDGFTATQAFSVRGNGLEEIRIDGDVKGEGREGVLDAQLVELDDRGEGGPTVARARYAASTSDGDCCAFRFGPLDASAGKRYRLDLTAHDFDGSLRLAFRALPARETGDLVLNGRPQEANLVLASEGAPLGVLKGAPRMSLAWVMAGFAILDAAMAVLLYSLLTSSGLRRS